MNYPESVALIATQLLEFIREGRSVSELMDLGRQLLGRMQEMAGVAEMIAEVQVEGTFRMGLNWLQFIIRLRQSMEI